MAGLHIGVQKVIKEINQKEEFVACINHSLNFMSAHASSAGVNYVTFVRCVEFFFVFFIFVKPSLGSSNFSYLSKYQAKKRNSMKCQGRIYKCCKELFHKKLKYPRKLTDKEENILILGQMLALY